MLQRHDYEKKSRNKKVKPKGKPTLWELIV